jgi:hypothetical protein
VEARVGVRLDRHGLRLRGLPDPELHAREDALELVSRGDLVGAVGQGDVLPSPEFTEPEGEDGAAARVDLRDD